ncbi:hypothetical protein EPIR_3345 [Erwinia piriflorinigrans CFBP 5888]|uniref:Uncharacterized protein n=1 Tax=Erwinia piriflorinigrans CFBP 5888 TaxID=1161919 RepID=V5ZBE0_9GAMM|nr:hypothetical protein EPIR_3345 [Erwinia piriflorinigrans CFBP 5888]
MGKAHGEYAVSTGKIFLRAYASYHPGNWLYSRY